MEQTLQPGRVIGAGRGALILAMAGAGWLGWGLSCARAFNVVVAPIFGTVAIFLWAWSIHACAGGGALRRLLPPSSLSASKFPTKHFAIVLMVEVAAIILVIVFVAGHAHRPDLATDGCTLVIGLHYIPLARIFGAPKFATLGILIAIWCIISGVFFRSGALVVAVTTGTGTLMWGTSAAILLWAHSAARPLRS
jgi:hypothetical protein